jgi:hypothetical protein
MRFQSRDKRLSMLIVVILSMLVVVLVLPSCVKRDTEKAKKYLKKGDEALNNAQAEEAEFQKVMDEQLQKALALSTPPQDPNFATAMQEQLMKALEVAGDSETMITDYYGQSRAGYSAIYDLQGVDDYKSYSDIRIDEIDLRESNISMTWDFLYNSVNECANPDFCPDEFNLAYQELETEIEVNTKAADALAAEAQKLKAEKNL